MATRRFRPYGLQYTRPRQVHEGISPHLPDTNPAARPGPVGPGQSGQTGPPPSGPPAVNAPSIQDATYNDAISRGWRDLGYVTDYVAGQQGLLRNDYGYADDNFTVDPSNPFSRASLLKRSYDQSAAGTRTDYAARGQQTSGAYGRAQSENNFNFQQGSNALQNSYLSALAQLTLQQQQAQGTYGDVVAGAAGDALQRALAARQVGTPPSAAPATGGPGAGEFKAPSAAHNGQMWIYRRGANGKPIPVRRA